jgi:hypothetical protein
MKNSRLPYVGSMSKEDRHYSILVNLVRNWLLRQGHTLSSAWTMAELPEVQESWKKAEAK